MTSLTMNEVLCRGDDTFRSAAREVVLMSKVVK